MRQTLRKRMVVAAATTGLLSLYGTPVLADTGAHGAAANSPGVASGNAVEVPVTVPVNVCGNTVDAAALGNPSVGNACGNTGDHTSEKAEKAEKVEQAEKTESAKSSKNVPERAAPVAEPVYTPAPASGPDESVSSAPEPEDPWAPSSYEEYTEPDAHQAPDQHGAYDEGAAYEEFTQDWDDGGYGHHDDSSSGYGDQPNDEETEGGYGDHPPTNPPTETPHPTKPPTNPPTKPPHPTKPPTTPPTKPPHSTHPPTKPPTHPPTQSPHPTKPPTNPPTKPPHTTKPPTTPPTKPPHSTHPPTKPPTHPPTHPPTTPPTKPPTLPETGSDREALIGAGVASFALIAGGAIVYRRGRAAAGR
ncbi:chaplin family protein [Streptomyces deccanensis]|uniref:chaplin family protein n=1 Tax=Streptomyces deccanensis TaxID=424188 RepID=UPI001EFAA77D|nr:chaplin family protein [Streptomyces deccanensis]ULR50731.1 chaplin [Streptomyces deccanensis]